MGQQHPRIEQLERVFTSIGVSRMRGVPMQNPALRVQCVGFEAGQEGNAGVLVGILITPWFMNLVRLPMMRDAETDAPNVGSIARHSCGAECFDFIASHEPAIGAFEVCSLFSPMFEFATHTAAVETAEEILRSLRTAPSPVAPEVSPSAAAMPVGEPAPARRSFLFGRSRPAPSP